MTYKQKSLRIILVAENVSRRMGGESGKNIYYFHLFRERKIDLQVVCHARVREELRQEFPNDEDFNRFYFIEDNWLQKLLYQIGEQLNPRIRGVVFQQMMHWITQIQAKKLIKKLISEQEIDIVFQPSPITPKGLNFMYNLGVPVILGPLSGGLNFPPAFGSMDSKLAMFTVKIGRYLSYLLNYLIPGKLQAEALIVANQKSREALPKGYRGKVYEIIESGVDLSIFETKTLCNLDSKEAVRFVYVGRFSDWKGIQFLIDAFQKVSTQTNAVLELIGEGELRHELEAKVKNLGIENSVTFHGWMKRENIAQFLCECDVFVMPSIKEAGGNAILEAMALGLPVIATKWGGPANIVDNSCGILVEPISQEAFINGLAQAMMQLAKSPELCSKMSKAASKRVSTNYFDWDSKVDKIIEIFKETLARQGQNEKINT